MSNGNACVTVEQGEPPRGALFLSHCVDRIDAGGGAERPAVGEEGDAAHQEEDEGKVVGTICYSSRSA
jgi:hypothetical protein